MPLALAPAPLALPRRRAQLLLATVAALPVASDRHESVNWGEESSCKGVAAVPGCPGQPACENTLQVPNCLGTVVIHCLPCCDPLNRE